jgi:hypothetical protein
MPNPLKRLLNPLLNILLSSTLRILLVLLLLVSCYTSIAMLILTFLPPELVITLGVLNVTISLHHWFVMIK